MKLSLAIQKILLKVTGYTFFLKLHLMFLDLTFIPVALGAEAQRRREVKFYLVHCYRELVLEVILFILNIETLDLTQRRLSSRRERCTHRI